MAGGRSKIAKRAAMEERSKITYDMTLMHHIALFEQITGARLRDCFTDTVRNCLTFLVEPGEAGKAIGKGAMNIRRLEQLLKQRVRIVEFADSAVRLVQNLIAPLQTKNIERDAEERILISGIDEQTNGRLIGRGGANLRQLELQVRRYYPVKEIKVV
ncbi:MAG TPA: NusA-like transcription termination signal-binding factor [Candidatus Nanoarchaeia archaeon]|nr:NusA-like transcription termination signal-binding factor [Candidatus Nanoarchaeia archaeon]